MLNFSATRGDLLLFSELTVLQVSDQQTKSSSIPPGNDNFGVDLTIFGEIYDFAAGYRFYNQDDLELYGYAGLRYMHVDANADASPPPTKLNLAGELGDDWIDPIVGIHAKWRFSPTLALQGRIEVGGWSSQPQESHMLTATLNQNLNERWSLNYFYRYMKVDYASDDFIYDLKIKGPGFGATYLF